MTADGQTGGRDEKLLRRGETDRAERGSSGLTSDPLRAPAAALEWTPVARLSAVRACALRPGADRRIAGSGGSRAYIIHEPPAAPCRTHRSRRLNTGGDGLLGELNVHAFRMW
ncbi:uncharacterized protein LOC122363449 [Amphibalanus amphitrite]|uniref:uncharacterized protein LOC122363449 n=1 Tax=Amphibalanus amphitrite TaxID=1232801 RepID=UPI001C90F7CD|nr:uncharacterized protein LOC122363449 [Amphibalanus amphitrite]